MKKKTIKLTGIGLVIGALVISVVALFGCLERVYPHEDGALIVHGKPYGWEPAVNWYPKGDTIKIGRSEYNSLFPVYLHKYEETDLF